MLCPHIIMGGTWQSSFSPQNAKVKEIVWAFGPLSQSLSWATVIETYEKGWDYQTIIKWLKKIKLCPILGSSIFIFSLGNFFEIES